MLPVRLGKSRENKHKAKKIRVDGILFASFLEANRYGELKILERAGEVSDIKVHPVFPVEVNGIQVCKVILDFSYTDKNGCQVHEDTKGQDTALSRLKRRMVEAAYSIDVVIVR
jgi:hypothetical protein